MFIEALVQKTETTEIYFNRECVNKLWYIYSNTTTVI